MRQFIFILSALLLAFNCPAQLTNPQSKEITEKFFPDPEVDINTPAFQKKRGFTDYEEMMAFINERLAAHSDVMSLSFIGKSQKGKDIPMIVLKRGKGSDKLRVWLQGGLHGNEPASTEGLLYLLDQLLNNPEHAYLLDRLEIAIVPMANIDGSEKLTRDSHNGLDLNRDQTKLMAPESVSLKQAFSDYQAHVALDFHEYRPYRRDFTHIGEWGVTNGFDVMFLYSGNLNVAEELRNYTKETFVKEAGSLLESKEITSHAYFSASDVLGAVEFHQGSLNSRSSATSYALANTISTLVEVRGIGIGRTSFKRRAYTTFLVGLSYLRTAYDETAEVKQVLARAKAKPTEAVVKHQTPVTEVSMTLIDLESVEKKDFKVRMKDAWQTKAQVSRPRPRAYLLMPEQAKLAEKLKILGLKIDTLNQSRSVEVERYTVEYYLQEAEKYEGVHRQRVSTSITRIVKDLPAGTFVIRMDQDRAGLAVEALEPEAPNSFVNYDVLHTEEGAELPVYRYLNKEAL